MQPYMPRTYVNPIVLTMTIITVVAALLRSRDLYQPASASSGAIHYPIKERLSGSPSNATAPDASGRQGKRIHYLPSADLDNGVRKAASANLRERADASQRNSVQGGN